MSDKKKILVVQNIHDAGIQLLKENPNYEFEIIEDANPELIKKKITECDGLSIRTAKLPDEIINLGKKLKIISRHGVGYDNIGLNSSKKNNITIAITATANAVAVAEHVMFMLLNISKRKNMYDETVKTGKFNERNNLACKISLSPKIIFSDTEYMHNTFFKFWLGHKLDKKIQFYTSQHGGYWGNNRQPIYLNDVFTQKNIKWHIPLIKNSFQMPVIQLTRFLNFRKNYCNFKKILIIGHNTTKFPRYLGNFVVLCPIIKIFLKLQ